jgi:hypothetical protein
MVSVFLSFQREKVELSVSLGPQTRDFNDSGGYAAENTGKAVHFASLQRKKGTRGPIAHPARPWIRTSLYITEPADAALSHGARLLYARKNSRDISAAAGS